MLFFEYMTTCPKCKVLMFDLIKMHFLGGAFTNPLVMRFSAIDYPLRGNFVEAGPLPVAPVVNHNNRYVDFVPVVHGRTTAVAFPKMVKRRGELFDTGSFTVRYLLKRLGEERFPPAGSTLNERYGAEVIDFLRKQFAI